MEFLVLIISKLSKNKTYYLLM